jgi:hypothetical protein
VLIRTDGSDGETAAQRYTVGVPLGTGPIHVSGLGLAQIGAKVLKNLDFPGKPYTKTNDVELIVSRLKLAEAIPSSAILTEAGIPGGIIAAGSLPALIGGSTVNIPSISWFRDPSIQDKPVFNSTPFTRAELVPLRDHANVEVIFQLVHNGESNTRPGIFFRARTRAGTPGGTAVTQDGIAAAYQWQIRNGGSQYQLFSQTNGVFTALAGSPVTPTQFPAVNQPYWYRARMSGSTLTIWNSPNGINWTQQFTVTNNTHTIAGRTYLHLVNGALQTEPPQAAHCHFPVIIANKL